MASDGNSFLPRLQSVFYARFDELRGPEIAYQVPEGLIASSAGPISGAASPIPSGSSRASSMAFTSSDRPEPRIRVAPQKNHPPSNRTLLNFDDISKYIIAQSPLCGRLVTCTAGIYKVLGFPVELLGKYQRNYLRFNVCFVFGASADLSCYEPVVRKVNRVLTACEEESSFLSSPETSFKIHAILEQLYEDLNSYSETSIPIDNFNSIELKIFPFYPNPPPVEDWMVPVALINFDNIIEQNWDLTMAKVCQYIDGINHVARIAHLAGCDVILTRQAISHLLYYQVIMTIDIFQYANMYTLRKSIQWLADETHVKEECGPYVSKEGRTIPDWPMLLHLYSRMRPGKTIFEWMQEHDIRSLGIDVRRLASFGVIKARIGFLRRVHRWPILLDDEIQQPTESKLATLPPSPFGRKRATSLTVTPLVSSSMRPRRRTSEASPAYATVNTHSTSGTVSLPPRAAEASLGTLRSRAGQLSPPTVRVRESRRHSTVAPASLFEIAQALGGPSEPRLQHTMRPRLSRSPSSPAIKTQTNGGAAPAPVPAARPLAYPPTLVPLLDGEHHTDELCCRFEVGWPTLERWLVAVGEGSGNGDFGKVLIIYR
ncbi:nitrogen permease regulator 2-domain-containing protein [Multifurca ochricompacta]|uniref:Nitrogen permease regulator 2-domain-containing protein n=1 Tax=Multifurca ochricompacta TaxID=376703 RepID=A0AAD4MBY3_9AGAM|nr:nitrogen permease regulator 2-domain-containing protein [Multifurca ochricompacta]